jgi:hypothetical protein
MGNMKKFVLMTLLLACGSTAQAAQLVHKEVSVFDAEVYVAPGSIDAKGQLDLKGVRVAGSPHQDTGDIYALVTLQAKEGARTHNIAFGSCQIGNVATANWGSALGSNCMILTGTPVPPKASLEAVVNFTYGADPFLGETTTATFPVKMTAMPQAGAKAAVKK